MTKLCEDIYRYQGVQRKIKQIEKEISEIYAMKTIVYRGVTAIPESELIRLEHNHTKNSEARYRLEQELDEVKRERMKVLNYIKPRLPIGEWVKVDKEVGSFLIRKNDGGFNTLEIKEFTQ
jgi:hypothetical protein